MALSQDTASFTWNTTARSYLCNQNRELKLSSIMKLQQEVGELHLCSLNMSYRRLYDEFGVFFVFTKLNSVIYRRPILDEPIKITTWCKGVKGVQFYRCYRFETLDGELLVDSVGSVATLSAAEHKILKPRDIPAFSAFVFSDRESTCEKPGKINSFEMENYSLREVRFSDLDYNGHMNNTVYADLMADYMPKAFCDKTISGFAINFVTEAKLGETLKIASSVQENEVIFCSTHDQGQCFTGICRFI